MHGSKQPRIISGVGVTSLRIISGYCLIGSHKRQCLEDEFVGGGKIRNVEYGRRVVHYADCNVMEVGRRIYLELTDHECLMVVKIDSGKDHSKRGIAHAGPSRIAQ